MDQIKVVALDPGETTGYATGLIENGRMRVQSGQARWNHYELYNNLKLGKPDVIVCESFEYRNRARPGLVLYSRELIGVVNLYIQETVQIAEKSSPVPDSFACKLQMQSASAGKSYHTDSQLKSSRLHKPGKPHANDATRHLLHWFTFGPGYKYNSNGYEPMNA